MVGPIRHSGVVVDTQDGRRMLIHKVDMIIKKNGWTRCVSSEIVVCVLAGKLVRAKQKLFYFMGRAILIYHLA